VLAQILSYILAANPREPITLHSTTGRRWRNELHALITVDWNQSISVSSSYVRDHLPLLRKSARSYLLDILIVSRAFYFAGIDAFFGGNVFALEDLRHLDKLTTTLDLDRRRSIRRLVFQIPMVETSFSLETDASGRRRATVLELRATALGAGGEACRCFYFQTCRLSTH
jgi:hypothetical protein